MKKIGFLSFGHWSASPYSQVRSGSDALIQSIELAEAAEDLGADGAYFRVHHFRPAACVAVPAPGGDRRSHQAGIAESVRSPILARNRLAINPQPTEDSSDD